MRSLRSVAQTAMLQAHAFLHRNIALILESPAPRPTCFATGTWDEAQKARVVLPSEADRHKKVVRATTRHLSLVAVISAEQMAMLGGKEVAEGDKGKWYYRNEHFSMELTKAEAL